MDLCSQIFLEGLRNLIPMLRIQSDDRLEKRIGKERLQDAGADVEGFILSSTKQQLNKNQQLALTCQLLNCLGRYVKENLNLPVTIKTVVDSIILLPEAVDRAFPGYSDSKMLMFVIQPRESFLQER